MKLEFQLSQEDIVNWAYYQYWESPSRKKFRIQFRWIIPLFIMACGAFLLYKTLLLVGGLAIAAGLLLNIIGPRFLKRMFRKQTSDLMSKEAGREMLSPQEISFSDEGLQVKSPSREYAIPYSQIVDVVETSGLIALVFENGSAYLIPEDKEEEGEGSLFVDELMARKA